VSTFFFESYIGPLRQRQTCRSLVTFQGKAFNSLGSRSLDRETLLLLARKLGIGLSQSIVTPFPSSKSGDALCCSLSLPFNTLMPVTIVMLAVYTVIQIVLTVRSMIPISVSSGQNPSFEKKIKD